FHYGRNQQGRRDIQEKFVMRLSKGLIKADIIAARQAIEYYEEKRIKDIKNVAAYHLQQAAEKLIKYQIYKSGLKIDNSRIYTHNIEKLILYGESIGMIWSPKVT
ncbi:MAG: hypothetical protein II842_16910, partial [Butyrivibrio sp.]|nr:hypothetical protein [Butyrivibrio sp.]